MSTSVEYRVVVDAATATGQLRALAEAQRQAEQQAQAAAAAALTLSAAERNMAAEVLKEAAAERERATALGLSVSQLRDVQAAVNAKAAAEKAASSSSATQAQIAAYERLTGTVDASAAASGRAAAMSGRNAAATANLRAQLVDVGVMLQGGANPFTILSTQGPQIAEALASMEGGIGGVITSLGSLGPAALVVAAAVVALGGAWLYLKGELNDATEAAERAADAATKAQKAHEQWAGTAADVSREIRQATGEISAEDAAAEKQIETWREQRQAQRDLLAARVANAQIAERATTATTRERQELQAATRALAAYDEKTNDTASTIAVLAGAKEHDRVASKAAEDASKAQTEAERRLREEMRQLSAEMELLSRRLEAQAQARRLLLEAANLGNVIAQENRRWEEQKTALERAAETAGDAELAMRALNAAEAEHLRILGELNKAPMDWLTKQTTGMSDTTAELQSLLAQMPSSFGGMLLANNIDPTTGAVTQLDGTNIAGGAATALAGADPTGIASAILTGFRLVGDLGSDNNIFKQIEDSVNKAMGGLEAAPEAIGHFLAVVVGELVPHLLGAAPEMVAELIPAVLEGVLGNAPELVGAVLQAVLLGMPQLVLALIVALTDPALWIAIGKGLVDSFGDAIANFFQMLIDSIKSILSIGGRDPEKTGPVRRAVRGVKDWFSDLGDGNAAGGRPPPERKAWLLHANEVVSNGYVVPASGMEPSTVRHGYQSRAGGGGVTVNMGRGIVLGTAEDLGRAMALEQQRLAMKAA